jgi:cytochrome c biogenesis protein CcmG/thiol:disulfide interchange protein DsbE
MIRALSIAGLLASLLFSAAAAEEAAVALDHERRAALVALPSLGGPDLSAEALEGRVTVVTFFASWCPPCRIEFEHLKTVKEHHGEDLVVVAVNIYENFDGAANPARMARFLEHAAPSFHLLAEGERVRDLFGDVRRIPTVFVFDAEGRARLHFIHARGARKTNATLDELEAAIAEAKAAGS